MKKVILLLMALTLMGPISALATPITPPPQSVWGSPQSYLGIALSADNGATWVYAWDQGAGDLNGSLGAVSFSGSVGNWAINVTTGLSAPALGSSTSPALDLNSVDLILAGGGPGTLLVAATGGGFNTPPGSIDFQAGGTASGTIQFSYWECVANWPYHTDYQFGPTGIYGPGGFSLTGGGTTVASSNYSLTIVSEIKQSGPGSTSFNASLAVPEPAAMLMLGFGLVGLFGLARRRNRK